MYVIVYGTLKKGGKFHKYMEGATYVEDVKVTGYRMYDTGYGYPCVAKSEGYFFHGELYKASETIMKTLDIVEGVRSGLFKRKRVSWVDIISDSLGADATIYVVGKTSMLSGFRSKPILDGLWRLENGDDNVVSVKKMLKDIKSKVTEIYAFTEGVEVDLGEELLLQQLKRVSVSVEQVATYISDNISKMENKND